MLEDLLKARDADERYSGHFAYYAKQWANNKGWVFDDAELPDEAHRRAAEHMEVTEGFRIKGESCKAMRWFSVNQSMMQHIEDFWCLKMILSWNQNKIKSTNDAPMPFMHESPTEHPKKGI